MYAELQRTESVEVRIKSLTITKLKTAIVEEVAEQRGMTFCKINLSQLEEVGDLCGMPIKEVLLQWKTKTGESKTMWWPESNLSRVPQGVTITSQMRTSYASPSWLPKEDNPNGCIVLLDDYTRKMNKNASFLA